MSSESAVNLVREGGRFLRESPPDTGEALKRFEQALEADYRSVEAKIALKSFLWWRQVMEESSVLTQNIKRGAFIMDKRLAFYDFLEQTGAEINEESAKTLESINFWVCTAAISAFSYNPLDTSQSGDSFLQRFLGIACKGTGNYDAALSFLETAAGLKPGAASILFELADLKALIGDESAAGTLFRKAFLLNPLEAEPASMRSAMFRGLYAAVRERGYSGDDALEWMPVWGTLLGLWKGNNPLNHADFSKLNSDIFNLETALKKDNAQTANIKPRLLNKYFWLVEHYEADVKSKEQNKTFIKETLLKINYLDKKIYAEFLKL